VAKLLGLIGILVVFAGLHLLWQSRREVAFWLGAYFRVFRRMLRQPGAPAPRIATGPAAETREGTLRMLLGVGLAFFLGPFLIALGLTFMFYLDL
jgi:hypothetical protein